MTDILERAKALLKDTDSSVGWSRTMIDLIAEVERKNEMMNIVENTSKYSTARLEEQIEALVIRAIKAERMVERLRSLNESLMENGNDLRTRCQKAEARIKELEADRIEARAQYLLFMNDNPGCIAWNFDELDETEQDALREQARYMLELEEPWAYIQLREAREQIKRLEAAFLKLYVNQLVGCNMPREVAEKHAREALERIKEGGKDE